MLKMLSNQLNELKSILYISTTISKDNINIICYYLYDLKTEILSNGKFIEEDDKVVPIDNLIPNLKNIISLYSELEEMLINNYPRKIDCINEFKTYIKLIILKELLAPEYFNDLFKIIGPNNDYTQHMLYNKFVIQYIIPLNPKKIRICTDYKSRGDKLISLYARFIYEELIDIMFRGNCTKGCNVRRKIKRFGEGWIELRDEYINGSDHKFVKQFLTYLSSHDEKTQNIFTIILKNIYRDKWNYVSEI
jgi:hypothetical protein